MWGMQRGLPLIQILEQLLSIDGIGVDDHVLRSAMLGKLLEEENLRGFLPFVRMVYSQPSPPWARPPTSERCSDFEHGTSKSNFEVQCSMFEHRSSKLELGLQC